MSNPPLERDDAGLIDDSIPLLTDRLDATAAARISAATPPLPAGVSPLPAGVSPPVTAGSAAIADAMKHPGQAEDAGRGIGSMDIDHSADAGIAARLESRVAARMLAQAGPLLEAAIETTVPMMLERLTLQLSDDLHANIAQIIREVVTQAVAEELALLQAREPNPSGADQPAPPTPPTP